jgi:hypothetical protein
LDIGNVHHTVGTAANCHVVRRLTSSVIGMPQSEVEMMVLVTGRVIVMMLCHR